MGGFGVFPFGSNVFGSGPLVPVIPPVVPPTLFGRPTFLKSDLLSYIRARLNDPNGLLWSDANLTQYINQAETHVHEYINMYWVRFPLNIQNGVALYDMTQVVPTGYTVKHITRITYRGFKIDIVSQKELSLLSPVYRTQESRPRWATWQYDGFHQLRLYPVPNEDLPILDGGLEVFTDAHIRDECIVSCYLFPQESNTMFTMPDYFIRRLVKYYVYWKAYGAEGPGQNVEIATYFKNRWKQQITQVLKTNAKTYNSVSKQYADVASQRPWRKARPQLPPNFGRVVD